MGITTRAGVARTLEYDKNDDLISEIESHKRIIIMMLIFTFVFCFMLQILIFLIFQNMYERTPNSLSVDQKETPKLNYHLQSIFKNGSVFRFPIIQSSKNLLTTGSFIKTFTFPKVDIQFGYYHGEDAIYFHGKYQQKHMSVTIYTAANLKYQQEKYFSVKELGQKAVELSFPNNFSMKEQVHDYLLPKNGSLIDIGDYILLYGTCYIILYILVQFLTCYIFYISFLSRWGISPRRARVTIIYTYFRC